MKYKEPPLKHLEFIKLVATGFPFNQAYSLTCGNPNLTKGSAKVHGHNLAKKYDLQIQQERENHQALILAQKDKLEVKTAINEIVSQAEADAKVFRILGHNDIVDEMEQILIEGNWKITEKKRRATPAEIQKAYELYCKRFGSYVVITKTNPNDLIQTPVDSVQVIGYLPAKKNNE